MTAAKMATALLLIATGTLPAFAVERYDVSGSTGNLYYEYEFDVPPARGRYQPHLFLRYGGPQGAIGSNGANWGIPLVPVIRHGYVNPPYDGQEVDRYDDLRNPERILLPSLRDGAGHYNADVEDAYMDFWKLDANTWCARDGTGNLYRFEGSRNWGLTQVVDPDGNVTKYTYRDINHITSIQYNVHGSQPAPPTDCRIVAADFATELAVEYQVPESNLGYVTNIRIKNRCPVSATCPYGQVTVRRYAFSYAQITWEWYLDKWPWSVVSTIDVLSSVTEFGGEDGVALPPMTFEYLQAGNDQDPAVKQAHLKKVITPLGAQHSISWADSAQFGDSAEHSYPVVRSINTTGPGLAPQTIEYGYAGVMPPATAYWVQSYFPPKEFRGFSESWATDSTTGIVKHSWWETASHPFVGREARVEYGSRVTPDSFTFNSYTPPTSTVFLTEVFENVARPITAAGATPTCTPLQTIGGSNFATEVPAASYPVLGFHQREEHIRQVDAVQLSSRRYITCADVDTWGHLGKVSVDPDTNFAGDEYAENTNFEIGFDPAAICKDCVRERTRTDPTRPAPNDRLEATYFTYGPTFQVTAMYRQAVPVLSPTSYLGTSYYPRVSSSAPNPDGTLASVTEGAVTTAYTYDSFRLRPETVSVTDANSTLVTTTLYDDFGRPYSVTGPSVSGRGDPVAVKHYAYDALGRLRIISQLPISGSAVTAATQAFEYANYSGSIPASWRTYDFAVPTNYTDPAVPQTSDVRQTVSWVDGLGREIQVRQRIGGTGSGNPGAGITQNLSQYRVAKGVLYDGAGRVTASIEPYYSASGAYADLRAGLDASGGQSLRVSLTSYDSRGRVSCSIARFASAAIPAVGNCTSSFSEDSSYARATVISYRGVVDGGNRLAVKTIPPENNYTGGPMAGPEVLYDAVGLLRKTTDAEGNTNRITYDRIGRQTKASREMTTSYAGSLSPSTRPTTVDTTLTLDLMGRTVQRTDPNIGRRTFVFNDAVNSTLPVTMRFDKTGDEVRYTYNKGRIKTTTLCKNTGGVLTCTLDSTLVYDVPYTTPASYAYTAGRISYATNPSTTIAFGYDQNGSVVRRDQWLQGIAGGFGSVEAPRLDGQSVASGITTPFSSSSYGTSYDSTGRPVLLSNGGAAFWAATGSAPTGAYDALGQLGSASLDAGLVTQGWTYGYASALLSSQTVRFGAPTGPLVYSVTGMTYRGTKLTGFRDSLSSTTYGYWYSNVGRLIAAKATPTGGSQLAQNSLVCVTYNATKQYVSGPSLGNIERTREGPSAAFTQDFYYSGTNVEASVPPPHLGGPDAPTSVGATTLSYDDYGRVVSAGGGAETFGYDLMGRMISITRQSGTSEKLYYDPLGTLVQRWVGTTVISYLGRRATVTGTLAPGCQTPSCGVVVGSVDMHVTLGAERRIASMRVYPAVSPRTLYYYRDRLGSVVATTLGGGLAGAGYRYSAHGALEVAVGESSDSASEIGYTGALKLSGGLLSMGARVYDPALKIWMQPDPLQPFKYDYADGDPVNKIDPTGMLAGGDDALAAWLANAGIKSGMLGGAGGIGAGTALMWAGGAGLAFGTGWLAGTWANNYLEPYIQRGLDAVFGEPGARNAGDVQAVKPDIKRINDFVRAMGGDAQDREDFGEYLHELKDSGDYGKANEKGDFTWEELKERWEEWLSSTNPPPDEAPEQEPQ